jgi:hypothetical protein
LARADTEAGRKIVAVGARAQDIDAGAGGNGLGNRNAAALAALDGTGWLPDVDLPSAGR